MSRQVSRGSVGEYQADEQAGVRWLSWRVSGRCAGRCRAAQLASIRQMSRQVSRGSGGKYQADEQASVGSLRWRVYRIRKHHALEHDRRLVVAERVAGARVAQAHGRIDVARVALLELLALVRV